MKKEELQKRVDEIKWFHSIELPYEEGGSIVTPGLNEEHCSEKAASERFGLPIDLTEKKVLDIGCNQGYMSFLSEKRGAKVTAIDPNQGDGDNIAGFMLAKEALGSDVEFWEDDLEEFVFKNGSSVNAQYDICLYYGVLYHVENPLGELQRLSECTKEVAIIETAISPEIEINGKRLSIWQFNPGYDDDPTNYFYPNLTGLEAALKHVGFKSMELIYITPGGERATVKAIK